MEVHAVLFMFYFYLVELFVSYYIKWIIWLSFSWALTVHCSLSKSNNPLLSCLEKIGTVNFQTWIVTNLFLKSSISQDVEWRNSRNAWQSLFKLLYLWFIFSYIQYCSMPELFSGEYQNNLHVSAQFQLLPHLSWRKERYAYCQMSVYFLNNVNHFLWSLLNSFTLYCLMGNGSWCWCQFLFAHKKLARLFCSNISTMMDFDCHLA